MRCDILSVSSSASNTNTTATESAAAATAAIAAAFPLRRIEALIASKSQSKRNLVCHLILTTTTAVVEAARPRTIGSTNNNNNRVRIDDAVRNFFGAENSNDLDEKIINEARRIIKTEIIVDNK